MVEEGFDAAYAGHFRRLTAQLYAYLGDMAEAQDVVQEAFTRAWVRWDVISRYDDPAAWVRRAAWNLATSRWRRLVVAASFLARQRVEVEPGVNADRVDIHRALATLPPNHRRAVVLHYLSDMSVSDIARETGVSENTVKSWLLRGRAAAGPSGTTAATPTTTAPTTTAPTNGASNSGAAPTTTTTPPAAAPAGTPPTTPGPIGSSASNWAVPAPTFRRHRARTSAFPGPPT